MKHIYTLRLTDIAKRTIAWDCKECGKRRAYSLEGVIGYVQPQDVGKRVYLHNGIVQVENEAQKARRV